VETAENELTLRDLPTGARILVRTKKDWRGAVISYFTEEKVTLLVCSPSGRTYRLSRDLETIILFEGRIPLIKIDTEENWRENFTKYDLRW
jgi:hypothetical protein